eukprot:Hpha_TRINITY_DN7126_c0_g2::TRINITY_DN7126_c0_g2_i1::g.29760::m.29760
MHANDDTTAAPAAKRSRRVSDELRRKLLFASIRKGQGKTAGDRADKVRRILREEITPRERTICASAYRQSAMWLSALRMLIHCPHPLRDAHLRSVVSSTLSRQRLWRMALNAL